MKNALQYSGVVVVYYDKGYGFAYCEQLERRVYFHIRDWHSGVVPVVGDEIKFNLGPSRAAGKPELAVDVRPTGLNAYQRKQVAAKAAV